MTTLARILTVLAVALGTSAYIAAIYLGLTACGILAALSAACVIGAGLVRHLDERRAKLREFERACDDIEAHFASAKAVIQDRLFADLDAPLAAALDNIRPLWPNSAGAPE